MEFFFQTFSDNFIIVYTVLLQKYMFQWQNITVIKPTIVVWTSDFWIYYTAKCM